ncbi:tetratricopeptide repeat protein [Mesorhizobium sp. M2A.F.Ca.ET.037.01.1.1]|uniref:adenylate/guanylate cyclase domain-containing protein n=1 Tax=unclassified Mesorhizobium TaxID=325217 RepID=UPI000F752345|nr:MULTISPECIES: adenylate/guanylate cyclase domain-containing protein [unclassified Mesorhizobium]RUY10223.1 tetratricopeptide repeat protein [Mesorhizobium sp. M2A.F.Ca.ET.040.01.1.1]AZO02882.1 adenylate/guanylate cyclase domain-containing protein [Mesorhizobium sp. M2A.F.Ca.ET.043.02.1.1]AZO37031.1 adenylate/guanylate cyclase domain-containing protein [Mesorhizobium sp. M2A.F.Ca.ET.046.03.2.1]RUW67733.1 tetratricopeptide repeat protein [Mesorhizobium sp. M2A.F.Ca.ET.067.02.1.1]RUX18961.1 te
MSETRKLAAILAADVVGYSRLAGVDEDRTLARLRALRSDLVDPTIAVHIGRVVKRTGDGALVEFRSVVDAVRCAIEVQNAMLERNAGVPPDRRIEFRIGIHIGDIVEESDGDLMGDGVNIAARLESIAEPSEIYLSGAAYEQVRDKLKEEFEDLGDKELKNIARPVRVYRVAFDRHIASVSTVPDLSGGRLAPPDKPSIAVLPFQNMSGDPEQEYFGDGIAEDIITALSKLRGFFVIARNSSFAYKGKAPDIRQVTRELGVRYVLEGSVRKAGERLRVTGQLIDAASGNHIWAERYDRPASDIFAVQDEITHSVVAAIEPQIYAAERLRLQSKAPESLDAWGCVVRAMPYIWTWVIQDEDTGINLLKRAIELDPHYARARSLLAWAFATRVISGNLEFEQGISSALALAQGAIDLDPDDAWAHFAAGYISAFSRRFGPAVEELNEALQRNPNFAFVHIILGVAYGYAGLAEDGLRQLEIARRLSPLDQTQAANLSVEGLCHLVAGRYAEAVRAERRAVLMRPNFGTAWRTLTAAAGLAGDLEIARQGLVECKRLQPNLSIDWVEKYHPLIRSQDRARYIEGLRRAGLE